MSACSVSVVESTSKKPCIFGVGFGCEGEAMWIGKGCRGKFLCQGHPVTCGTPGLILRGTPPRHYCTCAPWHRDGLFQRPGSSPVKQLPDRLRDPPPRLVEAKLGAARFIPGSLNETLTATYTMWNVLDAMMVVAMPAYAWQTGYVRELQLRRMVELARAPGVSTYCEIGFNGGHSSAAMLLANPTLTVHAFDLMAWEYSNATAALLRTTFGRRFRIHRGDSRVTVPLWASRHFRACDLTFIDGDHSTVGAMIDMLNMNNATAEGAYFVSDDINSNPGIALETLRALGHVRVTESYGPYDAPHLYNPCMRSPSFRVNICKGWGFAVSQYVRNPPPYIPALVTLLETRAGKLAGAAATSAVKEARAASRRSGYSPGPDDSV